MYPKSTRDHQFILKGFIGSQFVYTTAICQLSFNSKCKLFIITLNAERSFQIATSKPKDQTRPMAVPTNSRGPINVLS